MSRAPNPKLLLVEGKNDSRVLCELFEKATNIPWEPQPKQYIVDIQDCGGDVQVLAQIDIRWKESARRMVGVVIDADASPRWSEVKSHSPRAIRAQLPDALPPEGLVFEAPEGRRFGVWIMPDNQSPGMLETFLGKLRTSMPKEMGEHVLTAMDTAKRLLDENASRNPNARPRIRSWNDHHKSKAEIHTWLAWRDPPGEQLHEAVKHEALDVNAPLAQSFIAWMKRLYDL